RCRSRRSKARGMRKSSQKMPPSALSSQLAQLSTGLFRPGAARGHADRRNGRADGTSLPLGVSADRPLLARLRLLEGFLSRTDISDCAQHALEWLEDSVGVSRSLCLVRPPGSSVMVTLASVGLPADASRFSISVHDWNNPLLPPLSPQP